MAEPVIDYPISPKTTGGGPGIPPWMQGMDPNSEVYKKLLSFIDSLPPGYDTSSQATILNQYNMISGETLTIQDINSSRNTVSTPPAAPTVGTTGDRTRDTGTPPGGVRPRPGEGPVTDYGPSAPYQYEDWMVGAQNPYLLPFFGQQPQYNIPQEVYDLVAQYDTAAADMLRTAQETQTKTLEEIRAGGAEAIGTLTDAQAEALGYAKGEIRRIRDITKRGGKQALDELYAARKESLATLGRGGETALDLMKLQAFGGLPGEALTREQMEASTQGMLSDIRERAGGSSSALGAIAGGYGQQMGLERDIGLQRAQYQAQGVRDLAQGELDVSGRYAGAQYGMGADIASMKRQAALDLSGAIADTTKYYTDLQGQYARDISGMQYQRGIDLGQAQFQTGMNLQGAYQTGAEMRAAGLGTMAQYKDQEWLTNMYHPYAYQRDFIVNELSRIDPTAMQYDYASGQIGQSWAEKIAGQTGLSTAEVMRIYGMG